MSSWVNVRIQLDLENTFKDEFLAYYSKYSHVFLGSEGGLRIQFMRTSYKNWSSSSEADYKVESFTRVNGVVLTGNLRDKDSGDADDMAHALSDLYIHLLDAYKIDGGQATITEQGSGVLHTFYADGKTMRLSKVDLNNDESIEFIDENTELCFYKDDTRNIK